MELSLKLVTNCNLRILGETGTYPEKDNCYKVEVTTFEHNAPVANWTDNFCPKPVFEMWRTLKYVSDLVSKDTLELLINNFNEYGSFKWTEASNDAAMNEAENNI